MTKIIIPKARILVPKYIVENKEAKKKAQEYLRKTKEQYEKNNHK